MKSYSIMKKKCTDRKKNKCSTGIGIRQITNFRNSSSDEDHWNWPNWLTGENGIISQYNKSDVAKYIPSWNPFQWDLFGLAKRYALGALAEKTLPYAWSAALTWYNNMKTQNFVLQTQVDQMKILGEQKAVMNKLEMEVRILLERLSNVSADLAQVQSEFHGNQGNTVVLLFIFFACIVIVMIITVLIIISALKGGNTNDNGISKIFAQMIPFIMSNNQSNSHSRYGIEAQNAKALSDGRYENNTKLL